jgi:hypothetical protein
VGFGLGNYSKCGNPPDGKGYFSGGEGFEGKGHLNNGSRAAVRRAETGFPKKIAQINV